MNMFKSRRKAKEQSETLEALTGQISPPHKTSKPFKRRNKNAAETKPVFDLATALPNDNEFRTSLLMPNLSARFSMLREQDDPNSKLGKASDDSVLFPKRASRLNLFSTALADVAEVETIPSTFRPPFADRDRSNSIGDGYDSDGGSIMNRSRPSEGNNLFGGRQKLYRLNTSSSRNLNDSDGTIAGRYVYRHDVSFTHFLQTKSKEILDEPENAPGPDGDSTVASPATGFSKNRGTQSSTNSGPRRSSTAATSVASESPAFRNSGVDSVPTSRDSADNQPVLSVPKVREEAIPNRFMSPSKPERYRPSPFTSTSLRNASSPVVPVGQPLDFGFKTESRSNSSTGRYQTDSPTPGQVSESSDVLARDLQPNDRGKATALGLFNKPAREFDEHQFTQRHIQLHEENTSTMSGPRSASRASDETKARQNSVTIITPEIRTSTPQIPPIPTSDSPIPNSDRNSARSIGGAKSITSDPANMKARIESLIRKQNAELVALETEKLGSQVTKLEDSENKENLESTFSDNDDESDSLDSSRVNSGKIDESDIHPAFRNSYRVSNGYSRRSNFSNLSKTKSVLDDDDSSRLQVPTPSTDFVPNGFGLSGLIRTHLRHDSDRSSILPRPDSSIVPTATSRTGSIASASKRVESIQDDLDLDGTNTPRISQAPLTPTTAMSQVAQQFLSQAKAIKEASQDVSNEEEKPWNDLEPKHQRGESSETTKERREFDEDLAERRRKIREGLKSVTERDRSQSPANATRGQSNAMQAFIQQRSVTDPQPKAMKMLGLQSRGSQPASSDEQRGRNSESRGRTPEIEFQNKHTAAFARFGPEQPQPRSPTPPSGRYGRHRANSNTEDRSKSRTRKESNPPLPGGRGFMTNWTPPANDKDFPGGRELMMGSRPLKSPPPDLMTGFANQSSPRPSPISPQSPYDAEMGRSGPYPAGRTTPSSGRTTPSAYGRKRSVTKTMISEPTFVSSTSSVPLVHLPTAQVQAMSAPPVPAMNPRRRGNTTGEKPILSPMGAVFSKSTPLEPVPASPVVFEFDTEVTGRKANSPSPRKLRKANSEGGSMAAKARQQAMAAELANEKGKSPALPIFPNHSATALSTGEDGGMF